MPLPGAVVIDCFARRDRYPAQLAVEANHKPFADGADLGLLLLLLLLLAWLLLIFRVDRRRELGSIWRILRAMRSGNHLTDLALLLAVVRFKRRARNGACERENNNMYLNRYTLFQGAEKIRNIDQKQELILNQCAACA